MRNVPGLARLLVFAVGGIGACLMLWAVLNLTLGWAQVAAVAAAIGTDFLRVDLRTYGRENRVSITLDHIAIFFMLGFFGLPWALVTLFITTVFFGLTRRIAAHKVIYNVGTLAISATTAEVVLSSGWLPHYVAILASAVTFFVTNTVLISLVFAILSRRSLSAIWRETYEWMAVQHMSVAIAGFMLSEIVARVGWGGLLVAVPLPMLHYTYKLYARATRQHTEELQELSNELITTLAAVVDARDAYTFGHSTQVALYSVAIAEKMGYGPEDLERLHRSALLHDIGKVGIPERILFKPGRLTTEEYDVMKRHTTIGHDIIKQIRPLKDAADVALLHHERWNGAGYPLGLPGTEVGLDSRVVGVADTLDTMLSDRPYRRGCTLQEALAEIDRGSGTQFDPDVVQALHRVVGEKGPSFFVNSAATVRGAGANVLQWSPADLSDQVAAGKY